GGGSGSAAAADQGARSAAGSLRVVPRPAAIRHCPARRLRHGHRARGRLDLQVGARAGDDSISANAVQVVSVKIGLISLGCPKNLVDSEVMLGLAREAGHELTSDASAADVLVVNTCAFIDSAKQESVDAILEMVEHKKAGSCPRLIVSGCMAERYREELKKEIPEIDAVLGTGEVPQIVQAINGVPRAHPLTFFTGAGAPPPARSDAHASLRRHRPSLGMAAGAAITAPARPSYIYDADTPRMLA